MTVVASILPKAGTPEWAFVGEIQKFIEHVMDEPQPWPSRGNLDHQTVEIEAEAVAHIVLSRAGLKSASVPYLSGYINGDNVPPTVSLDLISKVAGKIDEMSRRLMSAPKPKGATKP